MFDIDKEALASAVQRAEERRAHAPRGNRGRTPGILAIVEATPGILSTAVAEYFVLTTGCKANAVQASIANLIRDSRLAVVKDERGQNTLFLP